MSAEEILFAIVSTNAATIVLLGAGADCRLYPDVIPQDAPLPAACYTSVIGIPENVMNGAPVALNDRFQVDAYDVDRDAARALSDAIEIALQDRDAMIANSCGIRCISYNGGDYDPEIKRAKHSKDYSFWTSR